MSKEIIQHHIPGVRFNSEGQAEIAVWAPLATTVAICLYKNNKKIDLEPESYGYWLLTTTALHPGDWYKFVLDGEEFPDPASLSQPEGVHSFSQAVDLTAFKWTDDQWKHLPLEKYIFYELHVGTFTPEGNFEALQKKLPYLKKLGITAIELMPVAQFPGSRNWGYDGVYPYAVQNSYGGPHGLQQLVNACHKHKIAVVLDVVYNHLGPEGNYFNRYGPYFTSKHCTPWGQAINYDDAWCDGVRNYYIENALMWFRDFHIDALRMDAVHAIPDYSAHHILQELQQRTEELCEQTGRRHYLIIECDLNDSRYIDPVKEKGFGMDAQWNDEFHHALRVTAGQQKTGYYADFNGLEHLAKSYKDAYVYDGIYSPHRLRKFGSKATTRQGSKFVVFSQNHDQTGNRMLGERSSTLLSFEMQKLIAGAVLVSPYLPMLFMGEEWSELHPFLYFVNPGDDELAEAIRKGRKAEFAAFHAEGEAPDPLLEETFLQSKLQWDLPEKEPHKTMLAYYRTLISLRQKVPVFRHPSREHMKVDCDETHNTLFVHRWNEEQHIVCMMNFSKESFETVLPAHKKQWKNILDSAAAQWKGPLAAPEIALAGETIAIQPESILIYTNCYV